MLNIFGNNDAERENKNRETQLRQNR